jgi:hypothetical protein
MDMAISQQVRRDLEEYDKWKLVTPECPKVKLGGENKKMEKVSEYTIEQLLISKNPYIALEVDNDTLRNYAKSNTVSENKICDNESNQEDNKHNPVRYCTSIKEPEEEPKKRTETQHNVQNQRKTQLKWLAKEDNETYSIPMTINQQTSREKIRRVQIQE